ncbi:MAG: hypothetical protein RSA91_00555 [Bacilli bacterium]
MRKLSNVEMEWLQKTFRIREEAIELYSYLKYYYKCLGMDRYELFNDIVKLSIKKGTDRVKLRELEGIRKVKGFTITQSVLLEFEELIKNNRNTKGETVEKAIAIFAKEKLKHKEFKKVNKYIYKT